MPSTAESALLLPGISIAELALIAALAAVSAITGGVAGYGTGALMPLILVPIIGAAPVVPIIAISAMFTNTARVVAFRHALDRRRAATALIAALPTCVLGAWLYTLLTGRGAALVIGATLIATVPLRRVLRSRGHKLGEKAYIAAAAGLGDRRRWHHRRRRDHVVGSHGGGSRRRSGNRHRCRGVARHGYRQDCGIRRRRRAHNNRRCDRTIDRVGCLSMHILGEAHRRAPASSRAYRYTRCRRRHRRYDDDLGRLPIIGAASRYGHFTSGGSDDKIDSTLPPVRNPKIVPRS